MRLVAIMPASSSPHGMIFARRQLDALRALGHHVHEFTVERRYSVVAIVRQVAALRDLLHAQPTDVVLAQYGTVTGLIGLLGAKPKLPFAVYFRGSDLHPWWGEGVLRTLAATLTSQIVAFFSDQVICVSDALRARLWARRACAEVIPSGVDFSAFKPLPQSAARAALGWTDGTPVVLFNGGEATSRPLKRADLARQAVWSVRDEFPDVRMEVVGDVNPDLMPLYYAASDCLILTSVREGSPNVVKEAAASSLPVISVRVGDVETSLKDVSPSWIVNDDEGEISLALRIALRSRTRSNGPTVCKDRFSQEITSSRLADVLSRCIKRR